MLRIVFFHTFAGMNTPPPPRAMEDVPGLSMLSPLVSVVIPVYKTEAYLHECVDSVLMQTYTRLEVILVDDGSPDACGAICDAYADSDDRVRVVHRTNGGLSAARNAGLDLAQGEFITFLDSDDWMDTDTIQGYVDRFRRYPELDLIESGIYPSSCGGVCLVGSLDETIEEGDFILNQRELFERFTVSWAYVDYSPSAWNKCYRRSLIGDQRFREGYVFEDLEFQLRLYARIRYYMRWGRINYYYRQGRKGAITADEEVLLVSKLAQSYDNMRQIILDLEELKRRGESYAADLITIDEHISYVASRFMTDLIRPYGVDRRNPAVRKGLYKFQKPYFDFLKSYPYLAQDLLRKLERNLGVHLFYFYMKCYLPLYYCYKQLKRG